ncbi:SDR family NAD(P)-dependent oxidoreductase [Stappia sp. TSB10P1A]|uniref:SDR family NAD(P)-dependent oxidoreductase n=1 Tax=Stappia sp. TSB10P1A TaxID=2003585 RepID=UPI001643DC1A|nr:SDR family NAD(P)-dependent oxidoreductase [Stappia sp. TSB10P1A]
MTGEAIYPDLKGRTVLVTGGGGGIGAEIVRQFAAQGASVGFIDLSEEPSRALVAELESAGASVRFARADLTDIEATRAAIADLREALGPVSILVNNAAHDERHRLDDVTPDYWDSRMAVNLKHQFFCTQAVAGDMRKLGCGAIVNMGSISWMIGQGGMAGYTAAKSAVVGLTRSLARDLGPDNIRVNCIAPGWIMTERQIALWLDEAGEREIMERQCLKRKLVPADVARVVLFFCSDAAGACTNQTYVVDGGWI